MATATPTRRRGPAEHTRAIASLHRQLNTMGRRLAKAQEKCRQLEAEKDQLRKALQRIGGRADSAPGVLNPDAVYLRKIACHALDGGGENR